MYFARRWKRHNFTKIASRIFNMMLIGCRHAIMLDVPRLAERKESACWSKLNIMSHQA